MQGIRKEKKREAFAAQPLRGATLLWSEWRERMRGELVGLFEKLGGAPAVKGVARTFSKVLKGLFKR